MKKLLTFFLCILGVYANAQQTISDWKYQKDFSSNPQNFVKAGKKIYFVATTPEHGRELWVTEGTTESTKLVKDIMVGENSGCSGLGNYAALEDGTLYFTALDNPNEKPKIWVTDGTEKGTKIYQNEVRGTLFHTGDELVEYKIDLPNDIIKIFHQDAKKDSILSLGYGKNIISPQTSYAPGVLKNDNFLTMSILFTSQYEPPSYIVTVDLKKQKVVAKSPQKQGFSILTRWQNSIYWAISKTKIGRINQITGKYDTLAVITNKQYKIEDRIRVFTASNDFFLVINSDTYTLQNNQFVTKSEAVFQDFFGDGQYNNFTSSYYDIKNDILYSYRNNETDKKLFIKGIRLSDSKLVKDFSIPLVRYASNLSSTKLFISSSVEPYQSKVLDVTQEKLIDLPYFIDYYLYPFKSGESTFFGTYPINSASIDKELYILDSQTDEIKLLKNINTTGISVPKIFTTNFNGKMIQVYSNEKGVMLGVSDGTKSGTKDLKLLVKSQNLPSLARVEFQEFNQRLGILFIVRTDNGSNTSSSFDGYCSTCTDSSFLFTVDKNFTNISKLASDIIYNGGGYYYTNSHIRTSKIYKDRLEIDIANTKNYSPIFYITDLTSQNSSFIGLEKYPLLANDNFSIVYGTVPIKNSYQSSNYLAKYNLKTQKIDTITKSDTYQIRYYVIEDKLYFENEKKCYVTDINTVTELLGIERIEKIFKVKNKVIILESLESSVTTQYPTYYISLYTTLFNFWQIDGNITKKVFSYINTNDKDNVKITDIKPWEINGKTFLISNTQSVISTEKKIQFYEIKDDLSFKKVYEIEENLNNINGISVFNSLRFLNRGIVFRKTENDETVIYTINDNFKPEEIYRTNKDVTLKVFDLETDKRIIFAMSTMSLLVTDGTKNGSKLLINKNLNANSLEKYYLFTDYPNSDKIKGEMYFSFEIPTSYGINLWKTDGTEAGTTELFKKQTLTETGRNIGIIRFLGKLSNRVFYNIGNTSDEQNEVWTTQGTTATTQPLKDINGSILSQPLLLSYYDTRSWQNLPKINNKLYFSRQTEKNGYEPWVTDGTPEGTKMVGDLVKGIQSSNPYQFVEINQNPYCIATEENKSLQLWAFCSNNLKPVIDVEKLSNLNVESVKLLTNQNNDLKYQWIKDGKPVENATLPTLTTQTSGTYQVKIEDKIGCASISDSVVVKILQKVLANEPITDDFSLNIYPNPTQGDLNVSFENTSQGNFEAIIYDIYGKVVSQQTVFPNVNNTIATQNLTAGTYIFRLSNGEKQSVRKVIKQ